MTVGDGARQAAFCAALVDEWRRAGITDVVVAPGSRSTPLVLAVARAELRTHVRLDERSASFFALGLALATGRPAPVICTSGTAAAHFHAAVIEAHQACVPMIVCTADRPPELHGVSAPQTVAQSGLYGDAPRWVFDGPVAGVSEEAWRSLASRAVAESTAGPRGPGPVHLNLGFRDPLDAAAGPVPEGRPDGRPWHTAERPPAPAMPELAPELSGRAGVIVAGRRCGRHGLRRLAAALGWPVLADARTQARGWPQSVAGFDAILRSGRSPGPVEVVLRLGEPPASKVLSQWLASLEADQIVVDPYGRWPDPERRATRVVHADPTRLCADLADIVVPAPPAWIARWQRCEEAAQAAIDAVLGHRRDLTEPGIARALSASLDPGVTFVVASSMPIRDLEWYGHPASSHRVLANRGANGIDGLVSTALGAAAGGGPVVAVLGDLAFLHDAGGLLGAGRPSSPCTIVVVDNDGGGIFSFLPQATSMEAATFERFFATPHGTSIERVAQAYGAEVSSPTDIAGLVVDVERALHAGGLQVVVARTDRAANVALHEELNASVAAALQDVS